MKTLSIFISFFLFQSLMAYSQCSINNANFEKLSSFNLTITEQDSNGVTSFTESYKPLEGWGYWNLYSKLNSSTNEYYTKIDTSFSIEQSSDSYMGNYAMHISSKSSPIFYWDGLPQNAFNMLNECETLVNKVRGWYKLSSDGNDSLMIQIHVFPGNGGSLIGEGHIILTANTQNYIPFEVPINYSYPNQQSYSITVNVGLTNNDSILAEAWLDAFSLDTIQTTSSLENISTNQEITIYPNPTYTSIFISLPKEENNIQISIIDISGKEVYLNKNIASDTPINISGLSKGIYTAILHNEKIIEAKPFIKM